MLRRMRGGLAMGALIALVAGVPLVLFHATRAFAPSRWPGWSGVWAGLTRPDDGTIVAVLLLVAGWVAWFYLMAAVVAEVASRRRGRRLPTLTLLQPGQLVARVLVGAVVALFLSFAPPTPASASEPTSPVETESAAAPSPAAAPSSATEAVPADDEGATHVVQAGDTLFGLAERYLGDGDRWPELAAANPNLVWDPDHIEPGWTLAVPKGQSSAGAVRETRVAGAAAPAGPTGSSSLPVAVSAALPADSAGPAAGDEPAGPAAVSAGAAAAPAGAAAEPSAAASGLDTDVDDGLDAVDTPFRTLSGVGSILAAGVLVVLSRSRARQLWRRPPGTPVPRPSPEDAREEDFLRLVARRDLVWHADRALRALAAGCAEAGCDLPRLRAARVTETEFQVFLAEPAQLSTPWVRTADEAVWVCPFDEIAALTPPDPFVLGGATPEDPLRGVQAPYPALVCVGQDAEGGHLLVDLEQIGTLGLVGPTDVTWEAMAAMSVELSTSTWADDLSVTTIDGLWGVEDIYHTGCLRHVRRLGPLLEPLSRRAADDRAAFATAGLEPGDGLTELHRARLRGSAADAVYPEILVLVGPTTPVERARLRGLLTEQPRVALAAVTTSTDLMGDYRLEFQDDGQAILHPFGIQITPQRLPRPVLQAMGRVIAVADQVPGQPPDEPPPPIDDGAWAELVAELEQNPDTDLVVSRLAGRPRGPASPGDPLGEAADDFAGGYPELATVAATVGAMAADAGPLTMPRPSAAPLIQKARQKARKTRTMIPGAKTSPYVRVLGPVVATGTTNLVEPSKINRLTEYLAYLVLNPDAKPASVDEAIWPDRPRETNASTRNTATSKLRRWLGVNESGQWHLPPFSYACASVGCDWKDWTALVGGKPLSHVSTQNLEAALALVRGRPFEGINNRGYRWADRLRQDMTIAINDVALELARRRFDAHDYRGAEQALATALNVSPGDEALWRLRISTCHAGGDHEGERAAIDGVCLIASELGCDLEDATVDLIEQLRREHRPGRR